MTLPSAYSEYELARYLASPAVLSSVADALSWLVGDTNPGDYTEIVNDALTADLK